MGTAESIPDKPLLRGKRRQDLQEMLREAQHPWEKKALENLLNLPHSDSIAELQDSQVEMIQKKQKQALQELRDLLSEGRQ
ncbi:hypothetical protein HPG69_005852 [Diceros bicornis minor]|uniref:Uncharacterized protein n=1 Tax=Diceros bicornis minor TaxID=77932 RepID=A0A7J7ET96_DICBM|nr:hypothetical protein HPG69_005852 [Diceros bicornis minor]